MLAVPLGACEQHGPHLPLDTDTRIAVALAEGLAARRGDVVVGPAVAYGSSGEHQAHPGTLSLGPVVMEELVVELVRSAKHWARGGAGGLARGEQRRAGAGGAAAAHGGSGGGVVGAAGAGRGRARGADGDVAAAGPGPRGGAGGRGGGRGRAAAGRAAARAARAGVRAVAENGVLGDPRGATAAEGHALLAALTDDLAAAAAALPPA